MHAAWRLATLLIFLQNRSHGLDWAIFLGALLVVVLGYVLSRRSHREAVRRQKSREIAERAVTAGLRFRRAERVTVDASQVKGLSLDELQQLSEKLEGLGFERIRDFQLKPIGEFELLGFARHFVHPEKKCHAEIMASHKMLDANGPLLCGFSSFLEQDWTVGCINKAPSKVNYFWRLPKSVMVYLPGADPKTCFQWHIELRDNVTRELGLQVLEDLTPEFYDAAIENRLEKRRAALRDCDILAEFAEAKRIAAQGEWVWLGDYPQERVKRSKGRKLRPLQELSPTYRVPQDDSMEQMEGGEERNEER